MCFIRIYFKGEDADNILVNIAEVSGKGSLLILGKVEAIGIPLREFYEPVDIYNKIFRRK